MVNLTHAPNDKVHYGIVQGRGGGLAVLYKDIGVLPWFIALPKIPVTFWLNFAHLLSIVTRDVTRTDTTAVGIDAYRVCKMI